MAAREQHGIIQVDSNAVGVAEHERVGGHGAATPYFHLKTFRGGSRGHTRDGDRPRIWELLRLLRHRWRKSEKQNAGEAHETHHSTLLSWHFSNERAVRLPMVLRGPKT
jgi:hypothetical protein